MAFRDNRVAGAPAPTKTPGSRRRFIAPSLAAVALCLLIVAILTVTQTHHKQSSSPRPAPAPPAPAGIATVTTQTNIAGFVLAFHHPTTGRVTRTVTVSTPGLTGPDLRRRFSTDFSMLVWATSDALHISRLTAEGYNETARWTPETNSEYATAYADAVVNPATGRVWFRQTRTAGNARSIQIVSIDPAVPGDKPHVESVSELPAAFDRAGAPATALTVALAPDPSAHADVVASAGEILAGSVTLPGDVRYECPAVLDADTLVCYASSRAPYGAVAKLQVDRTARSATMIQLVAKTESPVRGLLLSPDHAQMCLRTADGWLAASTAGAAGPSPLALEQPADTPLAWL